MTKALLAVCGACSLTSCVARPVGPARTYSTYEGKAVTSAEAAQSSVATVQLVASTAAFGPYTVVSVSEQEEGLSAVKGTFASIQPRTGGPTRCATSSGRSCPPPSIMSLTFPSPPGAVTSTICTGSRHRCAPNSAALDTFVARHG